MILEFIFLTIILVLNLFILISLFRVDLNSNYRQKVFFSLIIVSVICWVVSIMITELTFNNLSVSLPASRISFFSSILVSVGYYFFVRSFSNERVWKLNISDYIFWIPASVILSFASLSDLILKKVTLIDPTHLKSEFGTLYLPFTLFIAIFFIYSTILFYKTYKREKDISVKSQIYNILIGSTLSILAALTTNLIFPILGIGEIRSLGPLSLIFFLGFTYYAILRFRFLSINEIIGKAVYISVIGVFPYSIFFLLYYFQTFLWGSPFTVPALISGYLLSIIVVFAFLYLNKKLNKFISKKIINTSFNPNVVKDEFSKAVSTELDRNIIVGTFTNTLSSVLHTKFSGILIFNTEKKGIELSEFVNLPYPVEIETAFKTGDLIAELKSGQLIIQEELKRNLNVDYLNNSNMKDLIKFMGENQIELVTALDIGNNLKSILLLGYKNSGEPFYVSDIDFIESLYNIASVSISRASLYAQVESFAAELQSKVDEATQQVTKQRDEISEQLRKEKDMMDILGHELRTPLSIARNEVGMIEMYLNQSKGEMLERTKVEPNIVKSMENLRREVKLLETVLSSAQIENNRVKLQVADVDCIDVVNDAVEGLKPSAIGKNLELKGEVPNIPLICKGDRERIQEIVFNLVDNAIKYTTTGSVTVKVEDLGTEVAFSVIDTGEGIPKEDIPNLGKKFFRSRMYLPSSNTQVVRPGGTGIGLYVIFGLIELMKGRIEIQSEVNKGSTFKVYLPK